MVDIREAVLNDLKACRPELEAQFDIKSIALFGSIARNEAGEDSDIDILIEYNTPPGFFRYLDLKVFLEKVTGRSVDLVTVNALKRQLKENILNEAIYVS